jgi:hypothetical protein
MSISFRRIESRRGHKPNSASRVVEAGRQESEALHGAVPDEEAAAPEPRGVRSRSGQPVPAESRACSGQVRPGIVNTSMEVAKATAIRPPHIASPQVHDGDPSAAVDAALPSQRSIGHDNGPEEALSSLEMLAFHDHHLLGLFPHQRTVLTNVSVSAHGADVCHEGDN